MEQRRHGTVDRRVIAMVGRRAISIRGRRRFSRLEAEENIGRAGGPRLVIANRDRMGRTWVEGMKDGECRHRTERRHDKWIVNVNGLPLSPKKGGALMW